MKSRRLARTVLDRQEPNMVLWLVSHNDVNNYMYFVIMNATLINTIDPLRTEDISESRMVLIRKTFVRNNLHSPWLTLQWRHDKRIGVSNHQPHGCLLNRLFGRRSKIISKLRVTGLCAGNSPGTGEFPAQMASNAKNVSIWWRHHAHGMSTSSEPPNHTIPFTWRACLSGHWVATAVLALITPREVQKVTEENSESKRFSTLLIFVIQTPFNF